MSDLRLTARERTTRLTNAETVKIGRAVQSGTGRDTWFPDDTATPVVVVRDFDGDLPNPTRSVIQAVIGQFDQAAISN